MNTRDRCAQCSAASNDETPLKKCSKCKVVSYCSSKCQLQHWKVGHKQACKSAEPIQTSEEKTTSNSHAHDKMKAFVAVEECANCSAQTGHDDGGVLHKCSKCLLVLYCSRACQVQHWKEGGHKHFCIALSERTPLIPIFRGLDTSSKVSVAEECVICGDELAAPDIFSLPCKHKFHRECMSNVRNFGTSEVCPLCRAPLPPGPEKLFDEALLVYTTIERRVNQRGGSWSALSESDQSAMQFVNQSILGLAEEGNPRAQCLMAEICSKGLGQQVNEAEAVKWYRKSAERGYVYAQWNLGFMLARGFRTTKNEAEALKWLRKAAEQEHAGAQCNLGLMLANGLGTAKNENEAVKWYRKAAEHGHEEAQCKLGLMLVHGRGIAKNKTEAVKWLRKAAGQGQEEAQCNLAVMLVNNRGIDYAAEVEKWTRKAAEQGQADAQCNMGMNLQYGLGTALNEAEAVKWYRKAAEQGHADAQWNLGLMLENGRGTAKNEAEAAKWYRKAAEQGHADAQCSLGTCLEKA